MVLAHSGYCTPVPDTPAVAVGQVQVAVVGWAVVGKEGWQANMAPEDSVDPGRIAIHSMAFVLLVVPASVGVVVALRFPMFYSIR